jgi:galactokinase/mevalonate kinase-like predicted kinase
MPVYRPGGVCFVASTDCLAGSIWALGGFILQLKAEYAGQFVGCEEIALACHEAAQHILPDARGVSDRVAAAAVGIDCLADCCGPV